MVSQLGWEGTACAQVGHFCTLSAPSMSSAGAAGKQLAGMRVPRRCWCLPHHKRCCPNLLTLPFFQPSHFVTTLPFQRVQALVVGMLADAKLEVREMAATTLSGEF